MAPTEQGTVQKAHRRSLRAPAITCIAALLLICLYSVFAIHRVIASNASTNPPPPAFALGTAHRDVTYCNAQTLDIYVPSSAVIHPLPLAIFVHGGGMQQGDKTDLPPTFLNALAGAGFAVASLNYRLADGSLNYRLAPSNQFPAQIEDVKCGIRYLRAHASAYDLNPNMIYAFGTSYGGTLVTLAALTGGHSSFDVGPYLTTSSAIEAAFDMFGPADLPGWLINAHPQDYHIIFGGNSSKLVLASPTHYARANTPPIMIVQGAEDTTVPVSQSVELYQKLSAFGDRTQFLLVSNMGHMFAQVGPQPIDPSFTQIAADTASWFEHDGAGVLK
jgi:acetyl esterase/lipase